MKQRKRSRSQALKWAGLVSAIMACQVSAQTNAPAATPPSSIITTNEASKIVVEGLPVEETVLPTVRPVSSVMGDDRSIIDTPRSVSLVTKAQMEARAIQRATEFNQYSPGVYTPSRYGLANVPVIRGDLSEIYQNGQRTIYSRNSVLASFNQVEAMDIVKGPGSAVYGPQGQGPGGYVNFVTKTPYFDKFRGDVTFRVGTFAPEDDASYFTPEWIVDVGGPISETLAWRVSYLGRQAEGYHQNVEDRTQDIFGALTWMPNEKLTLEWNAQFYTSLFNEVIGINRVTQELIDDYTYIAGPVQPNNVFGDPVIGNPFFVLLDPTQARRVQVKRFQTINAPFDSANANKFSSQLISTYTGSDDFKVINRSYGEWQDSSKSSGYGYTEYVPENFMINNRLEFHIDMEPEGKFRSLPIKTISGVDVRYSELTAYQDFGIEPFFIYDVTQDPSTFILPGYVPGTSLGGGFNVPGQPGFGANPFPSSGNQESQLFQSGFFTQWDLELTEKFSVIAGGRLDYFWAEARSPEMVEVPAGGFYNTTADELNGSIFASAIYKFAPKFSTYVTYNVVNAVQGSGNFGGVDGTGGTAGLERSLSTESELIEGGVKGSFFDNKLFAGASVYQQTREAPQLVGPPIGIETTGFELEAMYQPNRNFNASANFTYQNASQDDIGYQQTGNYLDGYPVGFIVDGQSGTGVGSPNFTFVPPGGRVRAASVPRILFNAYLTYQMDNGFGGSIGPQFTGEQWQNQQGTLIIPPQFVINAFLFYRQPRWEAQINFFNITNEKNWTSIDPGFAGNDVIYPEPPFRMSGQLKFKF